MSEDQNDNWAAAAGLPPLSAAQQKFVNAGQQTGVVIIKGVKLPTCESIYRNWQRDQELRAAAKDN
jgi:hypothetical protein